VNIILKHNIEGINDFIKVFQSNTILKKADIKWLFDTKSYEKLLNLFGQNIGLTKKEEWIDLFYEAYILNLNSEGCVEKDTLRKNIIEPVIWAISNVDKLLNYTEEIMHFIDKKTYINRALRYLPKIEGNIELNFYYYIFMYNACVEENIVLLDLPFAKKLNEVQLTALLAHEMHHYLKDYLNLSEYSKNAFNDVTLTLWALENEGIADMCSFESLWAIYEEFGWTDKGLITEILENTAKYISDFNDKMQRKIINEDDSINLYEFIMQNQIIHPLGYKMAKTIERDFGIEELKRCVGKPLEFILKFNQAYELENGIYAFDENLIERLISIYNS
jgi:hypothetical protein